VTTKTYLPSLRRCNPRWIAPDVISKTPASPVLPTLSHPSRYGVASLFFRYPSLTVSAPSVPALTSLLSASALRRLCFFPFFLAWALLSAPAAEPAAPAPDLITPPDPFPSVVAFAATHQLPLTGLALAPATIPTPTPTPPPGDTVTFLLALHKKATVQQWLIRIETAALTASEAARPKRADNIIHTSTGQKLVYTSSPAALRVQLFGPFTDSPTATPSPQTKEARTVVNGEDLLRGIAEYGRSGLEIVRRMQSPGIPTGFAYYGGGNPVSAEAAAKGRAEAAKIGLTPAEEYIAFNVYFSLTTFFGAAMEIPACRDILSEVVAKPSVWSVARHLGVSTDFNYKWSDVRAADATPLGLSQPAYQLPVRLSLNDKPAVRVQLVVTSPRPPLEACAGILAVYAEHPTEPDRHFFLRLLSAQRGP
jgi:hypothetical protein